MGGLEFAASNGIPVSVVGGGVADWAVLSLELVLCGTESVAAKPLADIGAAFGDKGPAFKDSIVEARVGLLNAEVGEAGFPFCAFSISGIDWLE